jgi:hypothetical protein
MALQHEIVGLSACLARVEGFQGIVNAVGHPLGTAWSTTRVLE